MVSHPKFYHFLFWRHEYILPNTKAQAGWLCLGHFLQKGQLIIVNLAHFGITLGSAATLTSTSLSSSSIRISISLMSFLPNRRFVRFFHATVANIPIFTLSISCISIFRMGRRRWRGKNDRFNVHLLCYHHLASRNQRICIFSSQAKLFVFTLDCGLLPPP